MPVSYLSHDILSACVRSCSIHYLVERSIYREILSSWQRQADFKYPGYLASASELGATFPQLLYLLAGLHTPSEGDLGHGRVLAQQSARFLSALHYIKQTVRNTSLCVDLSQQHRTHRGHWGRLEHHRIPCEHKSAYQYPGVYKYTYVSET